ncbi:unnamed protein product [Caenorhabditis auriculariae]|uniref:Cyclin-dependent kinase 2-associated protein n=1 Tax=Caenorhabditis auriculariae TaxID=2777116 RepID=A0A8S1GY54_9PELO|nr:unnamed protein product [Caenorhabditis auriculariae]
MGDEGSTLSSAFPAGYQIPTIQNLPPGSSNYQQLLALIEEIGRDIRPSYTGNKVCAERLKRSLIHARHLLKECVVDADNDRKKGNEASAKALAQFAQTVKAAQAATAAGSSKSSQ